MTLRAAEYAAQSVSNVNGDKPPGDKTDDEAEVKAAEETKNRLAPKCINISCYVIATVRVRNTS